MIHSTELLADGLLFSAALTLVLAHTAHSEKTTSVTIATLIRLRLRFIVRFTFFHVRVKYKHVKLDSYGIYLRILALANVPCSDVTS
jgi:hypothetical protein